MSDPNRVDSLERLHAIYGVPSPASTVKVTDHVTPHYRAWIAASPFAALATVGPEGLDCSPRGDAPGFVAVSEDGRRIMMPDRRGNNRVDSLANIVRDPRCALLLLVPGAGTALRINGQAHVSVAPDLLERFIVEDARPRSVLVLAIEAVYFQCARAVLRAGLWDTASRALANGLPTPGTILAELSGGAVGGRDYDDRWPARARETLW